MFLLLKLRTAGLFVYTLAVVAQKTSFLITSTTKMENDHTCISPLWVCHLLLKLGTAGLFVYTLAVGAQKTSHLRYLNEIQTGVDTDLECSRRSGS